MSKQEQRTEALSEILDGLGIGIPADGIADIARDFSLHLEMEQEMSSYQHLGAHKEDCKECERLKNELSCAERERNNFKSHYENRNGVFNARAHRGGIEYDKIP